MKPVSVNNFVDGDPVEVVGITHSTCGPIVLIRQNIGSCSLQHSMRPEQARDMAKALLAAAEGLEPTLLVVTA